MEGLLTLTNKNDERIGTTKIKVRLVEVFKKLRTHKTYFSGFLVFIYVDFIENCLRTNMFTQFSLGILTSGIFSFAIYHSIRDRKHLKYLGQYEDLKKKLTESEYREVIT